MSLSRYTESKHRWRLFWYGIPSFPLEHTFTVDQQAVWRRHLIWSKRDSKELRTLLTMRFSSNAVFLSLLMSSEIAILFSPSEPADIVRTALKNMDLSVNFFAGLILCVSIVIAVAALYATFSAWAIVSTVSDGNTHTVIRSSLGLYCCSLPSRLIVCSIYFFLCHLFLYFFVLMPVQIAPVVTAFGIILIFHISSTYSAMGRIIIETGAMGEEEIFTPQEETAKTPDELLQGLILRLEAAREAKVPVELQYPASRFSESKRDLVR